MKVDKDVLVIHDWQLFCGAVIGKIYNDNTRGFKKEFQITSKIKSLDRENGILETQNTTYHLGKECK